ncbi:MAG: hypothetical protein RIR11_4331 [Bacteroidota bacterium]
MKSLIIYANLLFFSQLRCAIIEFCLFMAVFLTRKTLVERDNAQVITFIE